MGDLHNIYQTISENVILDCIFDEKEGIYYVLDIMCWSNHPVYDSEVYVSSA